MRACRRTVRVVRTAALCALLQLAVGGGVEAATGLDGLRLFTTPERRAALDGIDGIDGIDGTDGGRAGPGTSPGAAPPAGEGARTSAPDRGARGVVPRTVVPPPSRSDRPPPGSAVLRSARGVSRIVDGVPTREGPR